MTRIEAPLAIRTIAGALAVFVTVVTLNGVLAIAEPQQTAMLAQQSQRQATDTTAVPAAPQWIAALPADSAFSF